MIIYVYIFHRLNCTRTINKHNKYTYALHKYINSYERLSFNMHPEIYTFNHLHILVNFIFTIKNVTFYTDQMSSMMISTDHVL